jgi:hypothetical protein
VFQQRIVVAKEWSFTLKTFVDKFMRPKNEVLPGVNVTIAVFCDYRQFLAKKMAFFLKTNVIHS